MNSGPPPHTHEQDEALYILEGEIALAVGPERTVVKAGSLAYIPARYVHSFKVTSHKAKLLNFYLPGGFERVITETGVPAEARTLPPGRRQIARDPGTNEGTFETRRNDLCCATSFLNSPRTMNFDGGIV